jgi:hypothetical protein
MAKYIYACSISEGNMKTGRIPAFSLAPGHSCSAAACATCYREGCYARKAYQAYPNTRAAWDRNTELALESLPLLEADLRHYLTHTRKTLFRIHVSGDFISREYAMMWARIIADFPHIKFLAFTKQFSIIRGINFPANMALVLSAWPGTVPPVDLMARYPVAWLNDGATEIPAHAQPCAGHCEECTLCFDLRHGTDVFFNKH